MTGNTFTKFGVYCDKYTQTAYTTKFLFSGFRNKNLKIFYLNLQYCWDSDDLAESHLFDNAAEGCPDFLPDMLMQLSFLFRPVRRVFLLLLFNIINSNVFGTLYLEGRCNSVKRNEL